MNASRLSSSSASSALPLPSHPRRALFERKKTRRENTMSCCPPGATAYLAAVPTTVGSLKESNGVEFYETGAASSAAIILFPDVWGWNSGRTRALADAFAAGGYRVYVPKLLAPPLEGGTDGDGLPPTFDMGARGAEFGPWIKTVPWSSVGPKVEALLAYARAAGATSFGAVGCCWGGWAVFQASALDAGVKCGVIFHPSCHIEGVYGGDVGELCGRVRCPVYFMPAGGDSPDLYGPEGSLVTTLAAKFPGTKTKLFADMAHGWTSRGDAADPAVTRDVELAMTEAKAYFAELLPVA